MVKKGPCFHCGINSTPIWRNGPPEKPVLCNACGSRYRLWANLDNYTPKHAQHLCNLKNVYITKINIKNQHSSQNFNLSSIVSPKGKLNPSLWNCSPSNPSKKKSQVVQKKLTPIQRFQKQMLIWWKQDKKKKEFSSSSASASALEDEDLITQRVNNLIPEDEIGSGGKLLSGTR